MYRRVCTEMCDLILKCFYSNLVFLSYFNIYTSLNGVWVLFTLHRFKNLEIDNEVGFLLGKETIGLGDTTGMVFSNCYVLVKIIFIVPNGLP